MKEAFIGTVLAIGIAACASSPDKIQTSYVSPMQYRDYDCDQIAGEQERISRRVNALYGSLKKTADSDTAQMAVGMVLFWPALFFLEGGDGPEAAEYSQLKGERDALDKVAIQKKCNAAIVTQPVPPEKDAVTKEKQQTSVIAVMYKAV